jgi:peptidoglycan/LPS O-acetylase OafA/YrhL
VGAFGSVPYPGHVNGSLWTIQYEFVCYLLVMGLGAVGLLRRPRLVLGLALTVLVGYAIQQRFNLRLFFPYWLEVSVGALDHWPRLLTYFLAGAVFYHYRRRIPLSPWLAGASILVCLAAFKASQGIHIALPIFGTYLIFFTAFHPGLRLHAFARRGDFSYGLYLFSFPIQQLILHYAPGRMAAMPLFALSFALSLGAAVVSWHYVERPFLRFKPRASGVREPREAPLDSPIGAVATPQEA